ncbi:AlpA family transcriptional regulator [Shewanella sp. HL-SH8]|uniref:AlpA family transcriptional regulator n=1 Tax=Shewanella sp. HL-SH8 TaxID=3436242 RepID=UPI003EBB34C9
MKLIKLRTVMECTALARSTIYKLMDEGVFPKSVNLGVRSVAWVESEIQDWILERIEERNLRADAA